MRTKSAHTYDGTFFAYVQKGSLRSAKAIVPYVAQMLEIKSVLDVGCGRGVWISVWREVGVTDVAGVDGDYVERTDLVMPTDRFFTKELSDGFHLGRRFDLVQCLEVAEHLPSASAEMLVDSLIAHSDIVLFSAAQPGQGGEHHVNERPVSYWRDLFAARGYVAFDVIRPKFLKDRRIEPWYRFNTLLYVADKTVSRLPSGIRDTRLCSVRDVPDLSPTYWRARRALLRHLPNVLLNGLVIVKHRSLLWLTWLGGRMSSRVR